MQYLSFCSTFRKTVSLQHALKEQFEMAHIPWAWGFSFENILKRSSELLFVWKLFHIDYWEAPWSIALNFKEYLHVHSFAKQFSLELRHFSKNWKLNEIAMFDTDKIKQRCWNQASFHAISSLWFWSLSNKLPLMSDSVLRNGSFFF